MKSMKLRGVMAAVSGALLMGIGANAMADSSDDLLQALIAKGVLTEEEGAQLLKGREVEKQSKSSEIKAKFKDGIMFESADGQHSMAVEGRAHFDYHNFSGYSESSNPATSNIADNFEFRRARIGVKGKFYNDYTYEIQTNLLGSNTNTIDQAWLNVGWWKEAQFKFGRYKTPFGLEKMTSSNNIDFAERSFVNQLAPNEKLGAMIWGEPVAGVIYQANVFQNDFSEADNKTNDLFVGGRVAANIAKMAGWNDAVLHIGAAGFSGEYGVAATSAAPASVVSFRTEPRGLANIFRARLGGAGATTTDAAVQQDTGALELAAAYGPFKLQGEYAKASYDAKHVAANSKVSGDVDAWYVEALWLMTGESYADTYKEGAWGAIKPKNEFVHPGAIGSGAYGAWELGIRYSEFDASDIAIKQASAGTSLTDNAKAQAYTGGIKWILNPNVRFLLNYTRTNYDQPITVATGVSSDHEDALTLRGQLNF
ncbi:MAG: porin [Methylophilaceae bacterium]